MKHLLFSLSNRKYRTSEKSSITILQAIRVSFYLCTVAILIALGLSLESPVNKEASIIYFGMGIIAATIANSTGAGGGIVFLPIFIGLGMSPLESLATSIAIQCFGMSSGSLSWLTYRKKRLVEASNQWQNFSFILLLSVSSSCIGLLGAQYWLPNLSVDIGLFFSLFSILVGFNILIRTLKAKEYSVRNTQLSPLEIVSLVAVSLVGGAITSWISIGIGELLLVYLISRRFSVEFSVAIAVCVSAITVLTAIPYHIMADSINFHILIFAAPGAMIGGIIARPLATYIGTKKLKLMASGWIILSAIPHLKLFS